MEVTIEQSRADDGENRVTVALAGTATIGDAGKIREVLLAAFADCSQLLLDVGAVTRADSALLQLVAAARRTAASEGKEFLLAGELSPAFQAAAVTTGFLAAANDEIESA